MANPIHEAAKGGFGNTKSRLGGPVGREWLEGEVDWTSRSLNKVKGSLSGRWRWGPRAQR